MRPFERRPTRHPLVALVALVCGTPDPIRAGEPERFVAWIALGAILRMNERGCIGESAHLLSGICALDAAVHSSPPCLPVGASGSFFVPNPTRVCATQDFLIYLTYSTIRRNIRLGTTHSVYFTRIRFPLNTRWPTSSNLTGKANAPRPWFIWTKAFWTATEPPRPNQSYFRSRDDRLGRSVLRLHPHGEYSRTTCPWLRRFGPSSMSIPCRHSLVIVIGGGARWTWAAASAHRGSDDCSTTSLSQGDGGGRKERINFWKEEWVPSPYPMRWSTISAFFVACPLPKNAPMWRPSKLP